MNTAPILLFTYKRLDTLKETVNALKENVLAEHSELHIFSDNAKDNVDIDIVLSIREYLQTIDGFKRVFIYELENNKGLANSIIDGVTQIINQYDKVIVLEDDLKTTSNFLSFMNVCLNTYSNTKEVFSISGFSFNLGFDEKYDSDVYFLNRGWSWGWATWKDRWRTVDWSMGDYTSFITDKKAKKDFAKGGSDLNSMLQKQMTGKIDSWAIRWFFGQYKIKGLTLYPIFSKVYNNGFDQVATHNTGSAKRYQPLMDKQCRNEFVLTSKIEITKLYQNKFQNKMSIKARIVSKIETLFMLKF